MGGEWLLIMAFAFSAFSLAIIVLANWRAGYIKRFSLHTLLIWYFTATAVIFFIAAWVVYLFANHELF